MKIIKTSEGGFSTSDEDNYKLKFLLDQIEDNHSIADLLNEIEPESFNNFFNYPSAFMTEDFSNTDYLKPIHIAARYNNLLALKELASKGACMDVYTLNYGRSPLHLAAQANHPLIIDYLITEQNVPINIPAIETHYYDSKKCSPLNIAASYGSFAALEKLIILGANVNYIDTSGATALHNACQYGFYWKNADAVFNVIELLIINGAQTNLKARNYMDCLLTPMELIDGKYRNRLQKLITQFQQSQQALRISPISIFREDTHKQEHIKQQPKCELSNQRP